jgi:hypothetical protein
VPLQSELFRDDAALEACLVRDSAHVTPGSRGQHVGKIQAALSILEGALMDPRELESNMYGPSTADAVLAYKRKRDIVNRTYQQRADNIVGKMTIASLDREMAQGEKRRSPRSCKEPASGPASRSVKRAIREDIVGDEKVEQFPAILSVLFQLVRVRGQLGPKSFDIVGQTLRRANELVQPIGMRVANINGFSVDIATPVRFDKPVRIEGLRRAAEKEMPGFKKALRVLICPFEDPGGGGGPDLDTNAISTTAEDENKQPFDRFIVINSHLLRADHGTLLHEMIHCSRESLMGEIGVHDPDGSGGIFSWDSNRTKLFRNRAIALRDAFFSFKR